jgi:secreted trypsin-like serine protease
MNFYLKLVIFLSIANNIVAESYECGRREGFQQSLILNGNEAARGQFPWNVVLYYGNSFQCGGILISDRHVLTGSHNHLFIF